MKKPAERQHVSLTSAVRKDNGKPSHVVTHTPVPGDRRRLTFTKLEEADAEADRLETLYQHGHAVATKLLKPELVALILLCEQIPQVRPHEVVQFYLENNSGTGWCPPPAKVDTIGRAFIQTRLTDDYSVRQQESVLQHISRFIETYPEHDFASLTAEHYQHHIDNVVGGAGKTRKNHLITLRSMTHWARDVGINGRKFLPPGPTAADQVKTPTCVGTEHKVYTAEQFTRLLIATPESMLMFLVLGQFAGVRAAERERMLWGHWRRNEDGKLVLNRDVTKTKKRRRVDVLPNLATWLATFRRDDDMRMVQNCRAHKFTADIAATAKVEWIPNALRAGYASYHLELFDDAALTAKNDGHSLNELETDYKSIEGVTKKTAQAMFDITPESVLKFARDHKLPTPDWAEKG